MDCENIFSKKKDTCHISFKSIIRSLPNLLTAVNLHRGVEWVGSFLKNFQKGGEGLPTRIVLLNRIFRN